MAYGFKSYDLNGSYSGPQRRGRGGGVLGINYWSRLLSFKGFVKGLIFLVKILKM